MSIQKLTIGEVVKRAAEFLAAKGSATPRLDAELLVGHALGMTRLQLYLDRERPLSQEEVALARALVRRRAAHEPVAYIIGKKEFFGRDFVVTPAVLVPRPETELLVEHVAEELQRRYAQEPLRVLEFGTGSGVIAITLALLCPQLQVIATEVSAEAAEVARTNAQRHRVAERVEVRVQSDFAGLDGPFHAVVSNPPYIAETEAETLPPDVVRHEPHLALFGGPDGMTWIRWLFSNTQPLLYAHGFLALEIGAGMTEKVVAAAQEHGWRVEAVVRDYADHERVVRCARG
ncbi:MAG: peptide chain release factor N(5)-glutamine methyltransferase [Candidatus Sumerlaeaceae bacterium]